MKSVYLILPILFYGCFMWTSVQSEDIFSTLASSVNSFGYSLYNQVKTETDGNLVISPFNTVTMLYMLYVGCTGKTSKQLRDKLRIGVQKSFIPPILHSYLIMLSNVRSKNDVEYAYLIFINSLLKYNKKFSDMLVHSIFSGISPNNFMNETKWINNIVHIQTNRKLKYVIAQGQITNHSAVLLTDVLYFAGSWVNPFVREKTKAEMFYLKRDEITKVMTMQLSARFNQFNGDRFKVIELPFENLFSLYVILPKEGVDIKQFENELSYLSVKNIAHNVGFVNSSVTVKLPRVDMSTRVGIHAQLKALSITDIFKPSQNDFSQMFHGPMKIRVDKVVQKTKVKIEEDSTEYSTDDRSSELKNSFHVNRPFLFLIVDKFSKMILLMGRITDPSVRYYYGRI